MHWNRRFLSLYLSCCRSAICSHTQTLTYMCRTNKQRNLLHAASAFFDYRFDNWCTHTHTQRCVCLCWLNRDQHTHQTKPQSSQKSRSHWIWHLATFFFWVHSSTAQVFKRIISWLFAFCFHAFFCGFYCVQHYFNATNFFCCRFSCIRFVDSSFRWTLYEVLMLNTMKLLERSLCLVHDTQK